MLSLQLSTELPGTSGLEIQNALYRDHENNMLEDLEQTMEELIKTFLSNALLLWTTTIDFSGLNLHVFS